MSDGTFYLLEAVLFFSAIFGFCVWQLISVNRDIKARKEREKRQAID